MITSRTVVSVVLLVTLGTNVIAKEKKSPPRLDFYAASFETRDGAVPECTPMRTAVWDEAQEVTLEDANDVWLGIAPEFKKWQGMKRFTTMRECLGAVPKYHARYRPEHLDALEEGRLMAGMPFEFALMVLGPTDQAPSFVSMLNPVTGQAEDYRSFVWIRTSGAIGVAAFFGVLGSGALGLAGQSKNLEDATRYLKVAAVAQVAELAAWELVLAHARVVTIQVSENGTIGLLTAQ